MSQTFVSKKINPVLGSCFLEGAGRAQHLGSTELPTPGVEFLRARTDEIVNAILSLVRGMRDLKGSRNFPGENPSPEYDRGIEDCINAVEYELGAASTDETPVDAANERAAWLDEKKANEQ